MDHSDPAIGFMSVLPVRHAGRRSTKVGHDSQSQRMLGEVRGFDELGSASDDDLVDIQRDRRPDDTTGQRSQRRMHRMPEPYTVESVGHSITCTTKCVVSEAQYVFESVTRPNS